MERCEWEIPLPPAGTRRTVGAMDSKAGQDVGYPPDASRRRVRPNLSRTVSVRPATLRAPVCRDVRLRVSGALGALVR